MIFKRSGNNSVSEDDEDKNKVDNASVDFWNVTSLLVSNLCSRWQNDSEDGVSWSVKKPSTTERYIQRQHSHASKGGEILRALLISSCNSLLACCLTDSFSGAWLTPAIAPRARPSIVRQYPYAAFGLLFLQTKPYRALGKTAFCSHFLSRFHCLDSLPAR